MDRRELLGLLGGAGLACGCGASALAADGHGGAKKGGGMMAPVESLHAHFCGIHIAKSNPKFQIVAQHYCAPLGDEMHQCLLFDSCDKGARLLGVEYIISDRMYRELPDAEKMYWHPHTYEVLAGGLVAPSMSPEDEMKFMRTILTTWGKTWHTWPDPKTPVPLGEPLLMWALTADGQEDRAVFAARDKQFGISTAKVRAARGEAFGLEVPKVSLPKDLKAVGRQWTDSGKDEPTRRK